MHAVHPGKPVTNCLPRCSSHIENCRSQSHYISKMAVVGYGERHCKSRCSLSSTHKPTCDNFIQMHSHLTALCLSSCPHVLVPECCWQVQVVTRINMQARSTACISIDPSIRNCNRCASTNLRDHTASTHVGVHWLNMHPLRASTIHSLSWTGHKQEQCSSIRLYAFVL